jgi:mannosidase alpha-like ER degradation enhancer 1
MAKRSKEGLVAQWLAHQTSNLGVVGSSPTKVVFIFSINIKMLILFFLTVSYAATPLDQYRKYTALAKEVTAMFDHAFNSYEKYAFPHDEIYPIRCKPRYRVDKSHTVKDYHDMILGNFSLTMVDSLDSLVVFNRTDKFVKYSLYLIDNLNFDNDVYVSLFETNIRILGGLLSAHVL